MDNPIPNPEAGSNDDAPHDEYDPRDVADPYDTDEDGPRKTWHGEDPDCLHDYD